MFTLFLLWLFFDGMSDYARGCDWENSERNAELRHQELMASLNSKEKQYKKKKTNVVKRTRAIKEPSGRVLVEEVIVDDLEDLL